MTEWATFSKEKTGESARPIPASTCGLVEKITSHDHATVGSGSVVNEVQNVYNDFQQLRAQYQEHDGAGEIKVSGTNGTS